MPERLRGVAVVTFNYDRCFEQYMRRALQIYFSINQRAMADLMSHIQIHHVYGQVGAMQLDNTTHGAEGIGYGREPDPRQLVAAAKDLRTFTETIDPDSGEVIAVRRLVGTARRLVFLGLAYHRQNMDLLLSRGAGAKAVKAVYGTALGLRQRCQANH